MNELLQFMNAINPGGILNLLAALLCIGVYSATRAGILLFLALLNAFFVATSLLGIM